MKVLRFLLNGLEIGEQFSTDFNEEFHKEFAVGQTVTIKLPQRFLIRDGLGYNPQAIQRVSTTISLDQVFGIDFEWDSYEKAVYMERSMGELEEQYLKPCAYQLANELDSRCALFAYQNTNNYTGVLGTDATTVNSYLAAERRLFEKSCPVGDRKLIVSPSMQATLVQNLTTLFNPSSEISRQYKKGTMGTALGWDWYRSNNLQSHTTGIIADITIFKVKGASQSGSSLIVIGTNGDTLKKGDIFSMANVNQVNPTSRRSVGAASAQQFVVTQDATLTGGNDTIQISPAIKGPGDQYQNVDALPADAALITLWPGSSIVNGAAKSGTQGLALSKYAFGIVGAKFEEPRAVEVCKQTKDPETGLSVRFIRQFLGDRSVMINRFDMCVGFGSLYPDNGAVRVVGA
jgi:hypothetical protein